MGETDDYFAAHPDEVRHGGDRDQSARYIGASGQLSETIGIPRPSGPPMFAYYSRPTPSQDLAGVVFLSHGNYLDYMGQEVNRRLAHYGYATISWDATADPRSRGQGGPGTPRSISDDEMMADVELAATFLRAQPYANGKVAVMGFGAGGRHAYIAACRVPAVDAAIDCWGPQIVSQPPERKELQPVLPIDMTQDMGCPLLGLFGQDDNNPAPAEVDRIEEELRRHGKQYQLERYENTGHGFLTVERRGYRGLPAADAWIKISEFLEKHLRA
jgi:carboxymethylenebutenolidase